MTASPAVTLKLPVAVAPPWTSRVQERMLVAVQHVVIDEPEHVENRNQADHVRAENEDEERQQQRRPDARPLRADVRPRDARRG